MAASVDLGDQTIEDDPVERQEEVPVGSAVEAGGLEIGVDRQAALVAQIVERAEAEAQRIIAEARTAASAQVSEGHDEADRIVEEARVAADEIADSAESSARERSAAVLAETQSRLDQLLAEERDVRRALSTLSPEVADDATANDSNEGVDLVPERESVDPESGIDESLADFMKATLRNELRPE